MHLGDDVKTSSAVRKGIEILEQRGRAFACRKWSIARSPYYIMGMSCMQCTTLPVPVGCMVHDAGNQQESRRRHLLPIAYGPPGVLYKLSFSTAANPWIGDG
ncbi:hypothetical protein PISMIDRAFT_537195 [Pisolithus microcarpus 441]|uniref:Uncharacterized protein n=1 Tax=Pisolithus microcarpus 441 TaxID=765257 RepID=A0A0C9XFI8_9AGAM|nr:hypothetical protein PISMIDRAFT_537195 [Pisolithus microcarpus 441]